MRSLTFNRPGCEYQIVGVPGHHGTPDKYRVWYRTPGQPWEIGHSITLPPYVPLGVGMNHAREFLLGRTDLTEYHQRIGFNADNTALVAV